MQGIWKSQTSLYASGTIQFQLPENIPEDQIFTFVCILTYDRGYRRGEMIDFEMEGISKHGNITARKKLLTVDRQFLIYLSKWNGHYTSINPMDIGEIYCS